MTNLFKLSITAGLALIITGCAQLPCNTCTSSAYGPAPSTSQGISDTLVINVTGYGAPKSTFENLAQRRLMALRASELDAYRKLAEQVSGLHVVGDTRMDDFIAQRDRLRGYLNSFVQGAAITHQDFEDDGMAVTTMSLKISRSQMHRIMEEERRWHANGAHLPAGTAYHRSGFAPSY